MKQQGLGMQWKLAALYLTVSFLSTGAVAVGQMLATRAGLPPATALAVGLGAGLICGLAGSAAGFVAARSIKLRLWEAVDMAARIARGDFSARLPAAATDELGLLEAELNAMAGHLQTAVGDLRRLAEQNRQLAEEVGRAAALEERARLARDLHDTVNQQLFVLAMRSAAVRRKLEQMGGEAQALVPELAALEALSREAHAEARKLILQLRPTTLEQQGLGPALAEYAQAAGARDGFTVVAEIDESCRLRGPVAENLFRVAQEALHNVAKHAGAKTVWVRLTYADGGVRLSVADDGRGFDPALAVRPTAVGLTGMQERVRSLGGKLRVRSKPGEGTEVIAWVPLLEDGGVSRDPAAAGG
jgi:NarL family two-component system sensor histidine kinase LiaS